MKSRGGVGYVAVALVAAPVCIGALYSLAAAMGIAGAGASGFNVSRVEHVVRDANTWRSVAWTLTTAGIATAIATTAALFVAVRLRHSRLGQRLAIIPLAVPHVAASLAVLLLLGQSGLLSRLAFVVGLTAKPSDFPAIVYDRNGVALITSFAWKEFPFLAITAFAVLATQGDALAEVARTHGASARVILRRITLPLLARGIAPAAIAAFAYLLGQYEMAVLLAPSDPLPLAILTYERALDGNLHYRGEAHVLGLIALLLTVVMVLTHERTRRAVSETDA